MGLIVGVFSNTVRRRGPVSVYALDNASILDNASVYHGRLTV